MDEYQESNHNDHVPGGPGAQRWLVVAAVALLCIAAIAFAYGYHQQALVRQLSTESSTASASVNQLQSQVSALTAKLNDMTAAQTAAQNTAQASPSGSSEAATAVSAQSSESPAASSPAAASKPAHAKRPATKRRAPVDTKYTQLQAQLTEQQKQLKATQDEVEKNRADLEGSLSNTRDDLNGSIARTHEELVAMEKRGERSYFEFDLNKSKQFSRVGPLTLSLRKADIKHKNYNLAMIVDDDQMQKKNVNLFEPIWIHEENESQPVQIVVNKIGKDFVHGYVSAPKYKPSELNTSGTANGATVTPIAAKTPANGAATATATATPNPQPPPQSQDPHQPELY